MTLQLGPQATVRRPLDSVSNQPWEVEGLVRVLTVEMGLGASLVVGQWFSVSSLPMCAAQEAGTAAERGCMGWQHSKVRCWTGCGLVVLEHRKALGQFQQRAVSIENSY